MRSYIPSLENNPHLGDFYYSMIPNFNNEAVQNGR